MQVGLLEPNAEHCGEHLSGGWLLEGRGVGGWWGELLREKLP